MTDPRHALPRIPPSDVPYLREVKSYVLRAGRTTVAQAKAYEVFGPRFLLNYAPGAFDATAAFGRTAPLIMEIGFGMGGATAHIASVRPEDNFLCCEVHEPGVGALLKLTGDQGLENIRILRHDAVEVLNHMLGEASLDGVHIFFPDPWHKSRHHKRRLIQADFVNRLARHLKPGGYVWINVPANSPAPDHIYLVDSPEAACDLVRDAGFEVADWTAFPMSGTTLEKARKRKTAISCIVLGRKPT